MADYHPPRDRTHGAAAPTTDTPGARRPPAPGSGPARTLLDLQSTAGNHAVQRLMARNAPQPAAATIQRYAPSPIEKIDLDQSLKLKAWIDIAPNARTALVSWSKTHKQAMSVVNNFTWEEFRLVKIHYSSGAEAPTAVAAIRARLDKDRIEKFRTTGKSADGWGYDKYLRESILTVTHSLTFRTNDERTQAKGVPNNTVPYTRNFTASIGNNPALWEIHIHYAGNNTAQKAHAKLITDRHTHNQVAPLQLNGLVVTKCNSVIQTGKDTDGRKHPKW